MSARTPNVLICIYIHRVYNYTHSHTCVPSVWRRKNIPHRQTEVSYKVFFTRKVEQNRKKHSAKRARYWKCHRGMAWHNRFINSVLLFVGWLSVFRGCLCAPFRLKNKGISKKKRRWRKTRDRGGTPSEIDRKEDKWLYIVGLTERACICDIYLFICLSYYIDCVLHRCRDKFEKLATIVRALI